MSASVLDFIIPEYFFGAVVVGVLFCIWHKPEPTVIVKHPTPYNAGNVVYKDKASNCYEYQSRQVDCPADKTIIKQFELKD